MEITRQLLAKGAGAPFALDSVVLALQTACDKYQIDTPRRVAAFLANVGVESGGLAKLQENLNYSASRLAAVWPNRFANASHQPNALALKLAGNPQDIANAVYGGRYGNDNANDGWKYRGRGYIGTTFKANYVTLNSTLGAELGVDFVENPDALVTPTIAAMAAAHYFASHGCNQLADSDNFPAIVAKINGALPCPANSGATRIAYYRAAMASMP